MNESKGDGSLQLTWLTHRYVAVYLVVSVLTQLGSLSLKPSWGSLSQADVLQLHIYLFFNIIPNYELEVGILACYVCTYLTYVIEWASSNMLLRSNHVTCAPNIAPIATHGPSPKKSNAKDIIFQVLTEHANCTNHTATRCQTHRHISSFLTLIRQSRPEC